MAVAFWSAAALLSVDYISESHSGASLMGTYNTVTFLVNVERINCLENSLLPS